MIDAAIFISLNADVIHAVWLDSYNFYFEMRVRSSVGRSEHHQIARKTIEDI